MGGWKKEKHDPEITYTLVGACMSRVQALNKVPVPFLARIGMDWYDISYSTMIDALQSWV